MYKANKIRCTIYDMVLALFVVLFIMFAIMSPTIGNAQFYRPYANKNASVTEQLQASLKEKTDEIAATTGIVPQAFDFAVGQKKVASTQKEIVNSVFAGNNFDYSDSAGIQSAYYDGIKEYYRFNGLELDDAALERAVPMACTAFNNVFSIRNSVEMNKFHDFVSKYSIVLAVVFLVLIAITAFKIFEIHGGRTKVFSHYGSALLSAGDAAILISALDLVVHYGSRLYLTNNVCFNDAFSSVSKIYFAILLVFGVCFDIAGVSMLRHVRRHYTRKARKQRQEDNINRSLYVKREDGDDKTIEEIYKDRRKELLDNGDN